MSEGEIRVTVSIPAGDGWAEKDFTMTRECWEHARSASEYIGRLINEAFADCDAAVPASGGAFAQ